MLIAAIVIWLIFFFLAVACCRAAASADRNDLALRVRRPLGSTSASTAAGAPARARAAAGEIARRANTGVTPGDEREPRRERRTLGV
jgi:hypothetical protein